MQAIPLYHQIYLKLREQIMSGALAFGERVPTEQEVAEQTGVSRITARRALAELAEQKLVERRRRTGTRVIYRAPVRAFRASIDQALESLLDFGRSTKVELIEAHSVPAQRPISDALEVEEGAGLLRVVRVRWLDDIPIGYFTSYVPADVAEGMTGERLRTTPMITLIEQAGFHIDAARQTITATLADGGLSTALSVDIGSPILRVERTLLTRELRPVQFIIAHFRPDRYQISLDLQPPRL